MNCVKRSCWYRAECARYGACVFSEAVISQFRKESDEEAQPTSPADPLGPRSAERHDRVYLFPHTNQRDWCRSFYERYESTMRRDSDEG